MSIYKFVVRNDHRDPRSIGLLSDAKALGFCDLQRIVIHDLYFIEGQLSKEICGQLALRLLIDPVTQTASWGETTSIPNSSTIMVEVALRPGVTDPVAEQIIRASHELGFEGVQRAATGLRFLLDGIDVSSAERLAKSMLANNVIQRWKIGEIAPAFPQETESNQAVEILSIRNQSDGHLLDLSKDRRAALDLIEMKAIQKYCEKRGSDLTDVEFEMVAQTWSEHCVHKTFKARVDAGNGKEIDSIIKTYLQSATKQIAAPWVISAFVDNAGIIDFDDEYEVSFKVETHNHPSAIEPFGGANTGIGGVIRDVLAVSAKPIAATDIFCFGPQNTETDALPEGILHPRRIQSGVVAGVQDYGNKIGIPTVNGAISYDEGFVANPLVFCGCVGISPKGKHVRDPQKGDRVIVLGGRTGRDGLRGATFSSMTMDAQTGEVSGASVQIGDPIVEKGLIDVITRARDSGLYHAVNDCGAGGLSSAVGEIASLGGADVELSHIRLKYAGLAPWEIWLSEAQERMVLAVPPEKMTTLQDLCDTFDTELTDLGEFTSTGHLVVRYEGSVVVDLDNKFLHKGLPQRHLKATIVAPTRSKVSVSCTADLNPQEILLKLLAHPNIASKAGVIRVYDYKVQGGTIVEPLTGVRNDGPSDATVIKPIGTRGKRGIVLSNGINPEYGKRDAYRMAKAVIDEAVRNAVAVGADPTRIGILDNFCWGDPLRPETMGTLVEAARGCREAALIFGTPFISGKDSLNNEYFGSDGKRHAIPPTLLISAIGLIEEIDRAVTMDLKEPGNLIYLVGGFQPAFGGSHFLLVTGRETGDEIPDLHPSTPRVYQALHQAMMRGLARSAHDLSEGGLAVTAAEMCIGGRLGMSLENQWSDPIRMLFGESTGSLLVEISKQDEAEFLSIFKGLPVDQVGTVSGSPSLQITVGPSKLIDLPLEEIINAWDPSSTEVS